MSPGARSTSRPGAGPGRGKPRARTSDRAPRVTADRLRPPESDAGPASAVDELEAGMHAVRRRRSSLTTRAIALAVVFLILTISYATSLRVYFAQSASIAATTAQISDQQARIADLRTELTRWHDPEYVKIQARTRFGWVLPGETGFTVVGADGQPLGGGAAISSAPKVTVPQDAWYAKLWGSVEAADHPGPAVATKTPAQQKPITVDTKPSPSAAPR